MQLVKEYIEFERGLDPKDAMNIGMHSKLVEFLKNIGEEKYFNNEYEPTLLALCGKHDRYDLVDFVLSQGADINGNHSQALRNLAHFQKYDMIIYLLEKGANFFEAVNWAWIMKEESVIKVFDIINRDTYGKYLPPATPAKITNETQNFTRGLDPKEAMHIGNPDAVLHQKFFPIIKRSFKKLLKLYSYYLKPNTLKETSRKDDEETYLQYIEMDCEGTNYKYFLGYNVDIKKFYSGYTSYISINAFGDEAIIDQEIDPNFKKVFVALSRYIQKTTGKYEVNEKQNFIRGLDPKEAMNVGHADVRFATFMVQKEEELKLKDNDGPIWLWWESYSGDFWEDVSVNNKKEIETDFERWQEAYKLDKERAAIQKGVIQKLLTIEAMPDDISKWLWAGPNKRDKLGHPGPLTYK